ncbi:MAG: VCBS repeat-containing protein [Bacteroidetes bacterium]|nr:MAG: VCBS repeat-containing protein [Bacteroidota bacterium]
MSVILKSINGLPLLLPLMILYLQTIFLSFTHPANVYRIFWDSFCPSLPRREGIGMGKSREKLTFKLLRHAIRLFLPYAISSSKAQPEANVPFEQKNPCPSKIVRSQRCREASFYGFSIWMIFAGLVLVPSQATAQQSFTPKWYSLPWDSGGYDPSSVVWSMVQSELDLDRDGKKEFLLTTSWSSDYYNMVYLYEAVANDSFQIVWSYSLYPYSSDFSVVTVSDLNNNGRQEIVCLVDPADTTYHGFYLFEWDGTDNGFPALPTTTWDFGLGHWFHEGTAIIAGDFDNDNREEVAVSFVESWDTYTSKLMIFSAASDTLETTSWQIEFVDSTTMPVVGYALAATDLDNDNRKELVVAGWDTLRMAIYENTGSPNSYALAANIKNISSYLDLSNDGIVEANVDNDGTNELYMLTANGALFVATNTGDVSQMNASNFFWLGQYDYYNGMVGLTKADLDTNGIPELYLAGSYNEAVYQWTYNSGPVTDWSSYSYATLYMDDTTDDHTSNNDQGYFRPSKIAAGDLDGDGIADMLISSASFANDKPVLLFVEQAQTSTMTVREGWNIVSLPVFALDSIKTNIFPSAVSSAFAFTEEGYQLQDTLKRGIGYWLKFSSQQDVPLQGAELLTVNTTLMPGWNMVGAISQSLSRSDVVTIPGGLLASDFFGYASGYTTTDTLRPGKGYWVKSSGSGQLILQSILSKEKSLPLHSETKHTSLLQRKIFVRGHRP